MHDGCAYAIRYTLNGNLNNGCIANLTYDKLEKHRYWQKFDEQLNKNVNKSVIFERSRALAYYWGTAERHGDNKKEATPYEQPQHGEQGQGADGIETSEELEAVIIDAEDEIKRVMGDDDTLLAGAYKVTWTPYTTTRFKRDHSELAAAYPKTITARRFSVR